VAFGTLAVIPLALLAHPKWGPIGRDFVIPGVAGGVSGSAILLIVALIGTTVAPWQLFFQQSNVLDKRISPRWLNYERAETFFGAILTSVGAAGVIMLGAALFYTKAFGPASNLATDSGTFNRAISVTLGHGVGAIGAVVLVLFALVGAAAVPLSTAYAYSDAFGKPHSLHHGFRSAPFFHGLRALQLLVGCAIVIFGSNALLGTLTQYVQVLAGILLPSASLFLVLLCNDAQVLGPWINKKVLNFFAVLIVAVLLVLSADLTIATLFPHLDGVKLSEVCFAVAGAVAVVVAPVLAVVRRRNVAAGKVIDQRAAVAHLDRKTWRMSPLDQLTPAPKTMLRQVSLVSLRVYLIVALVVVAIKVFSPFIH
jgi:Mn2+/Fe2+ NRAMP family transporter